MIKVGGLWVSPADVEACLVRHPAVSEAAVIGVSVEDVSRIKAFVIRASAPEDGEGAGRRAAAMVQGNLRRYEFPHVVEFVEDLPRTPTGKVQRYKLREAEAGARASSVALITPSPSPIISAVRSPSSSGSTSEIQTSRVWPGSSANS